MTEITTVDTGPEKQRITSTEGENRTLTHAETQEQALDESVDANTPAVESDAQQSTRTPDRIGGVTEPDIGVSGFRVGVTDHEPSQWKTRAGLPAEDRDIQRFVNKAETYQFHRNMKITDNRELQAEEVWEASRDTMAKHFKNIPTLDYLYSVDTSAEQTEVDVVMTGDREQMWADRQRIEEFQSLTQAAYDEAEGLDQELRDELTREKIEEMDHWREQVDDHDYDIGVGRTTDEMAEDYGVGY